MPIVYKATNKVNGKVYIGQTIRTLEERAYFHFKKTSCTFFHNALLKYGKENFNWEVLNETNIEEELNYYEKYWITFYKSNQREFGYNLTDGGRENFNFTKEIIEGIRQSVKDYFSNDENRAKQCKIMQEFFKNNPDVIERGRQTRIKDYQEHPEKRKEKGEQIKQYYEEHPEARKLVSQKTIEQFSNPENRLKQSMLNGGKPFYAIKGEEIRKFNTQGEAGRELKMNVVGVGNVLRGKSRSAKGWFFSYNEPTEPFYAKITHGSYLSYDDCKEKIKKLSLSFKTNKEHKGYIKNSLICDMPVNPEQAYRNKGWISWYDFLDQSPKFLSFEECKNRVKELGIKTIKEYMEYIKENKDCKMPSSPRITFKNKGFISLPDFFGRPQLKKRRA